MISVEEQTKYNYPLPSYPKGRDGIFMPTPLDWLTVKQVSDNLPISEAQPRLWRIHNKLYDLTKFKHPGGKDFIEMTMNTDITELFETSHLQPKALKEILQKYYVADIATPRFTAYLTFEDKGFYCTLRQRVYEYLQSSQLRKKMTYWQSTAFVHDMMLIVFVLLLVPISTSKFYSNEIIAASIAAGMVLACIGNCAHNFFHLANNWRAFSFDLCLNSSYEWRISHVYSHHNYANTVLDYEINAFEPMINFMPYSWKQAWYTPVVTMLLMVVVFPLATMIGFLKRMAFMARGKRAVRWEYFLGLIVFLICAVVHMMVVTKQSSGSLLEAVS